MFFLYSNFWVVLKIAGFREEFVGKSILKIPERFFGCVFFAIMKAMVWIKGLFSCDHIFDNVPG